MTDGLNNLSKMDSSDKKLEEKNSNSSKYTESKRKIREICSAIASPSEEYNSDAIINLIDEYISDDSFLNRILYSEVSGFIYGLEDLKLENFISNIDTLQAYISDKQDSIGTKTQNAIVKLCDHAALAKQQKELTSVKAISELFDAQKKIIAIQSETLSKSQAMKSDLERYQKSYSDIEESLDVSNQKIQQMYTELRKSNDLNLELQRSVLDTKKGYEDLKIKLSDTAKEYNDSIKQTQKDYISIFGVFSAIIITFVGGLSFTTSVMDGIDLASPYRIVFIVALIGFVVINMVHYLVHFLWRISGNENNKNRLIIFINIFLILLMVFDFIVFFLVEKVEFIEYITEILQDSAYILNQVAEGLSKKSNK